MSVSSDPIRNALQGEGDWGPNGNIVSSKYKCDFKEKHILLSGYSQNLPIVCNNAEFYTIVSSNALGNVEFRLVDAHFDKIRLISPLYIVATGEGIFGENISQLAEEPLAKINL